MGQPMNHAEDFKDLTVVVTGAGSGIGLETAKILKGRGAKVFGLDLQEGGMAGIATFIECNVGETSSVEAAFKTIDSLDVLINNAGVGAIGSVETSPEEDWHRVFNVNVYAIGRITKVALPLLRKSKHAAIVNTCSIAATAGLPKRAIYSASKGAVLALTLAMANDHLADKIRVNCVNPGTADTPWVGRLLEQASDSAAERRALEGRQPMGRLVTAAEVANAICYLASPLQSSTTGISLAVDGGMQGLRIPK